MTSRPSPGWYLLIFISPENWSYFPRSFAHQVILQSIQDIVMIMLWRLRIYSSEECSVCLVGIWLLWTWRSLARLIAYLTYVGLRGWLDTRPFQKLELEFIHQIWGFYFPSFLFGVPLSLSIQLATLDTFPCFPWPEKWPSFLKNPSFSYYALLLWFPVLPRKSRKKGKFPLFWWLSKFCLFSNLKLLEHFSHFTVYNWYTREDELHCWYIEYRDLCVFIKGMMNCLLGNGYFGLSSYFCN